MVDAGAMKGIILSLLAGFERDGYTHVILLSGHYPNGRQYLQPAMEAYRQSGGAMQALAIVETEIPGVSGDHAAKYETSSLLYLEPEIVDMGAMEGMPPGQRGGPEERINWMEDAYQNHPCYGLYGIDPREHASAAIGMENTRRLVNFLKAWLKG
jgi:creatinine amidohydrolase/Fe(II)-dependent formamide hydrolase-like protein